MRFFSMLILALAIVAVADPAFAQATNPYNVSWSALNPGNDWAAQVVQSLFPVNGATGTASTGNEATVIGQIVGQFTGFIAAIACAFVCYNTIMAIHRAAESSQILGSGQSWIFVARVGFAAIMMFPLGGGFSAGQQLVMQGALWGVGMAKALYTNAIQAVGPDAVVIAQPMIPGTGNIVQGLINSELCMDLVNLAGGSSNQGGSQLVPVPTPVTGTSVNGTGTNGASDGYITWRYSLSTGNESGDPVCGSIEINVPGQNQSTIAGVPVNMAGVQQAVLTDILTGDIRTSVATVASNLWQTKNASALSALQGIYTQAVNDYTNELTTSATSIESAINQAIQSNAANARNGNLDLLKSQVQQQTLGWTAAGAYYLEIARLNAATLSLLSDTPIVTSPTYAGLGQSMSYDLAPLESAANSYIDTLRTVATTSDGTAPPDGVPTTLASVTSDQRGSAVIAEVFKSLNLSQWTLNQIITFLLPTSQVWTDPFGGLLALGQTLMNTALISFGMAGLLSSTTAASGLTVWNVLTFNWGAAAATVAGHALIKFLAVPIFALLTAILAPGIIIAYVLPMIPYVLWMAGVCGWIILVCEAMIAVPLWMLAHMTFGGDGLHGRGIEGWGLLFNVMFRPTLMVLGLFLGYFVYDCMSWLIRESFGIAAGFALDGGWFVTNMIGMVVLLNIFVMLHVTAALMSFRMVTLLPHHLPRLIGLAPANRVDAEQFYQEAAWGPGSQMALSTPEKSSAIALRAFPDQAGRKACPVGPQALSLDLKYRVPTTQWTRPFAPPLTRAQVGRTIMSDALTAASIISDDLSYYRMVDGLRAACARRNYESEIAYIQACNEWLARNLKRVCAANSTLVETANAREADYRRRIADLERQVADLDAKYKERDAQAVQEASRSRDDYRWLVGKHKSILSNYRTLLMSVPPSTLSGSLLADYNAVTQMARERE